MSHIAKLSDDQVDRLVQDALRDAEIKRQQTDTPIIIVEDPRARDIEVEKPLENEPVLESNVTNALLKYWQDRAENAMVMLDDYTAYVDSKIKEMYDEYKEQGVYIDVRKFDFGSTAYSIKIQMLPHCMKKSEREKYGLNKSELYALNKQLTNVIHDFTMNRATIRLNKPKPWYRKILGWFGF